MSEHIRHLSQHSRVPISVLPNAGLPSVVDGKMHYDLTPEEAGPWIAATDEAMPGGRNGPSAENRLAAVSRASPASGKVVKTSSIKLGKIPRRNHGRRQHLEAVEFELAAMTGVLAPSPEQPHSQTLARF